MQLTPAASEIALLDKLSAEEATKLLVKDKVQDVDPDEILNCARCGNRITAKGFEASVNGSHIHTCTNPAEITYRIGCFSGAWGCRLSGQDSIEHTWFPGYSWRISNCSSCNEHLGWAFSDGTDRFYGLILARLVAAPDSS